MRHLLLILAVAVALTHARAAAAQQVTDPDARPAPQVQWADFTLEVGDRAVAAQLGRFSVPAVRGEAESGEVELAFVRLASRAENPGPPIVYLDGGPGGSGYGIARVPEYYRLFDALREISDVILLSQRGTGLSRPALACGLNAPLPADVFSTRERMIEVLSPEVEACAERFRADGVDLRAYTTRESADDLESLRRALGADSLGLLGFSYGTHLGLAALRRHGRRIHRAVFIGTEGPDHTYKLPSTGDLQLQHLSSLIAADPDVVDVMPDLHTAVDTLLRRLDAEPLELTITTRQGERAILLGGDGMRYLIRRDLGDTNDHPLWPVAFRWTLDGSTGVLARLAGRRFNELAGVPLMAILMDCASGASPERRARIQAETPSSMLGEMTDLWYPDVCELVPEARLDDEFRSRFTSEVPTLFLSGNLDANTPPDQAAYVSWGWPAATHLVIDKAGHEAVMPYGPAQAVIADFFRGQDVSERHIPAPELDFLGEEEVAEIFGG